MPCKSPVLLINPTCQKLYSKADYFVVDGNICDKITFSEWKRLVKYYVTESDGSVHKQTDPGIIDHIVQNNYVVVSGTRINTFVSAPCRRCSDCCNSRRMEYEARALFEASDNPNMYFFTLTYDDWHLPGCGLLPRHVSDFNKRFRENLALAYSEKFDCSLYEAREKTAFRVLYVGEYGSTTFRPHYHGVFFFKNRIPDKYINWLYLIFHKSWKMGRIDDFQSVREPAASARYICKYLTKQDLSFVPAGKNPCFIRGPHKCGLGASNLASHIDDILNSKTNSIYLRINGKPIRVMIPKFLLGKIFPCFSQKYGKVKDVFFDLYHLRDELKARRDIDPFTSCIDPAIFNGVFDKFSWLLLGNTKQCSKKHSEEFEKSIGISFHKPECIDTYFASLTDDEVNSSYISLCTWCENNLPTESEFFLEFSGKFKWLQQQQIPALSYSDKCLRSEKRVLNNVNYVEKHMLNENFDLFLHI